MDLTIMEFLLILFLTFPLSIYSKDSCPNSSCGSSLFQINYPFKLETDQPPINCYNSINLRCDDEGHTVINIPSFGDFFVTDINYDYRRIALTYAGDCLPRMLMTNFSVSPLAAFSFVNYTFYMCSESTFIGRFEIRCLRNSSNATIVMTRDSSGYFEGVGCKPIVSSMIPVSSLNKYEDWENFGQLELTWNSPSCRHCEHFLDSEKQQGEAKSKVVKLITGSTVFVPLAVIFTTFFGIACCIRLLKLLSGGGATPESTEAGTTTTSGAPPQATTAPPGTTSETSKVENFSQVMIIGKSHQETMICCSICLEEYHGKDRVRSLAQCGHLFHAECIDQWLQKNTTCPMCRSSLSVF